MMRGFDITCLIPAYNEAARIGAVLDAVAGHPMIAEVIVIDDASTDATAAAAQREGVELIRLEENRGKTWALSVGIAAARSGYLMLLDADLIGLTAADITALIAPVREGRAEMSISLRGNAPWLWRWIGLDYISGERVFARDLLGDQHDLLRRLPKFGFEVHLNSLCLASAARIGVVRWPGVASPYKARKYGVMAGLRADALMMRDIFRTIPPTRLLGQLWTMLQRRVPG